MKYFLAIKNVADIHKFIWKGDHYVLLRERNIQHNYIS